MDLIKVIKQAESGYFVYAGNDVRIGEIFPCADGYYQFWPDVNGGYWPPYLLRAIADKIDELNEPWDTIIKNDPAISGHGEHNLEPGESV